MVRASGSRASCPRRWLELGVRARRHQVRGLSNSRYVSGVSMNKNQPSATPHRAVEVCLPFGDRASLSIHHWEPTGQQLILPTESMHSQIRLCDIKDCRPGIEALFDEVIQVLRDPQLCKDHVQAFGHTGEKYRWCRRPQGGGYGGPLGPFSTCSVSVSVSVSGTGPCSNQSTTFSTILQFGSLLRSWYAVCGVSRRSVVALFRPTPEYCETSWGVGILPSEVRRTRPSCVQAEV